MGREAAACGKNRVSFSQLNLDLVRYPEILVHSGMTVSDTEPSGLKLIVIPEKVTVSPEISNRDIDNCAP